MIDSVRTLGPGALHDVPSPSNFLDDVSITLEVIHELCYHVEALVDNTLGAVPVNTEAKTLPMSAGTLGVHSGKMADARARAHQAITRINLLRSNLGEV